MPRVPFPFPISIGTDILQFTRVLRIISSNNGKRLVPFTTKILHPLELEDLEHRFCEWRTQDVKDRRRAESLSRWLGGRWAAKEAGKKAWGATSLGFKDVRVEIMGQSGEVQMICTVQGEEEPVEHIGRLSISHDGDYVVATVLATPLATATKT